MKYRHLTIEELQKYTDASDLSDTYLVWMEGVMAHLMECPKCQSALQKMMLIDSVCIEENFTGALELVSQEEAVRREILIAKLQQMQEMEQMESIIRQLRENVVTSILFQMSDLRKRARVMRGDELSMHDLQEEEKIKIAERDGKIVVKVTKQDNEEKITVLLDRKNSEPSACGAIWNESENCFVAEFQVVDSQDVFEVYIIR